MTQQSVADFVVRLKRKQFQKWLSPFSKGTPSEKAYCLDLILREQPTFSKIVRQSQYYCGGSYAALFKFLGY